MIESHWTIAIRLQSLQFVASRPKMRWRTLQTREQYSPLLIKRGGRTAHAAKISHLPHIKSAKACHGVIYELAIHTDLSRPLQVGVVLGDPARGTDPDPQHLGLAQLPPMRLFSSAVTVKHNSQKCHHRQSNNYSILSRYRQIAFQPAQSNNRFAAQQQRQIRAQFRSRLVPPPHLGLAGASDYLVQFK